MPRRARQTRKKAKYFIEDDVDTSVLEVDLDQMRKDAFLLDFDMQVQRAVSTMNHEAEKLKTHIGLIMTMQIRAMPENVRKMTMEDFAARNGNFETLLVPENHEFIEKKMLPNRVPLTDATNSTPNTAAVPQSGRRKRQAPKATPATSTRTTRSKTRNLGNKAATLGSAFVTPLCKERTVVASTLRRAKQGEVLFSQNQSPVVADIAGEPNVRLEVEYLKKVADCKSPQSLLNIQSEFENIQSEFQKLLENKMKEIGPSSLAKK